MRSRSGHWFCTSAMGALFALGAGYANAQSTTVANGTTGSATGGIEQIIVTAEKRSENIQETPISITAFTAADIERSGIHDFADIARATPGLQYGDFGDEKLSPTSLRGIVGSAGSAGADPAVGFYVDEVYAGQGAGADLDLYDIDRVEVLRGPQGTLFGRNTIGGVISITTEKPSDTFHASASADFGNYTSQRLGASISGPLIEGLLDGKISGLWDKRAGYEHNVLLGISVNDHDSWSARGQLLFTPGSDTEILITGSYRRVDQHPLVFETLNYNNTMLLPQLLDLYGLPRNTNPYDRKVYSDTITHEKLNAYDVSMHLTSRLGAVGITNIASYHSHNYYSRDDTDRSPVQIAYDGDPEKVWHASEEFRVDFATGPVDWLAGIYYFRQRTNNQSFIEIGPELSLLFVGDTSLAGLITGANAIMDTTSVAGFASTTWHATGQMEVTAGARYTDDAKKIDYSQSDPLGILGGSISHLRASKSWTRLTPNFNARYHFTPDILGYVTVAEGFKSGGYNDGLGSADGIAFGPESLWNYEGGVKSDFFDHHLRFDAAIYYMKWSKIQITIDNPATPIYDPTIINAGAAHSEGVELELDATPADGLLLGANLSIQDAKYDEGTLPTGQPLRYVPYAPNYTATINGQYTIPIEGVGSLSLYGEYLMRGRSYLTPDNQLDGRVNPYGLIDARIALESGNGMWHVAIWGKNLTNEIYKERLFDLSDQALVGQKFIVLGDPQTFGIELKMKY